jgi:hypothetical protein
VSQETSTSTHDGLPVKGYKPQRAEAVALVNVNKELEEYVLRQIDQLRDRYPDIDLRWLAIGQTDIEQGFMAINRAIFRPERADLAEDK